jgi:hypothetical protein
MIHLEKSIIVKIIEKYIKSSKATEIASFIVSNSGSDLLHGFISMLLTEESITLFQPGDYFKTKVPYGHNAKHFYEDKLIDLGLFENGYVFGKIIKSNDWHNEHDPYYVTMKCQLFYGDDLPFEHNLRIFDIEKIQKSEIPHYNGQYITRIIDETFERVSDIEEHNVNE